MGCNYYCWHSALGPVWAETRVQSGDWYGSGTLQPGQVLLGVACHCFPPLFRCSHFSRPGASTSASTWEIPAAEVRTVGGNFAEMTSTPFRDLLHAANLRHGTDGFTSPPKEGVLRIFSPLKIRRLRPGLNPRTWVLKASTLPLDHRSRVYNIKNWDPAF